MIEFRGRNHYTNAQIGSYGANGALGGLTFYTASNGTTLERVRIDHNGNVGIGTTNPSYTLHVVGTAGLSSGTSWANASDIRLKDIDGDYEYGLDEIKRLHTVRFHYKQDNPLQLPSDHAMTGFIAQEVQKVIPDAVKQRADGYLELNVDPIHWATVNAVKELAAENAALKQRVDKAEERADRSEAQTKQVMSESLLLKQRADRAEERAEQAEAETAEIKRAICLKIPEISFCSP